VLLYIAWNQLSTHFGCNVIQPFLLNHTHTHIYSTHTHDSIHHRNYIYSPNTHIHSTMMYIIQSVMVPPIQISSNNEKEENDINTNDNNDNNKDEQSNTNLSTNFDTKQN
jgi:hypothetical protein